MISVRAFTCAFSVLAALVGSANAQKFPSAPVTIVVPLAPGGATDVQARILADGLSKKWGQSVVVENRPGAGGAVGTEYVARRKPDGFTLLYTGSTVATAPLISGAITFDPFTDFTPIAHVASTPFVIATPLIDGVHNVSEFIAYSKAAKNPLFYAALTGTALELDQIAFFKQAGIDPKVVYYQSAADIVPAILTNQVQSYFFSYGSVRPLAEAGKVRIIGVTGLTRLPVLPNVAPVADTLPGYEAGLWFGLYGPASIPDDLTRSIQEDVSAVVSDPAVKARFEALGMIPKVSTSEEMAAMMQRDYASTKIRIAEIGWTKR